MDKKAILFLITFIYILVIKIMTRSKNKEIDINRTIEIKNIFVYNYSFISNYKRFFKIISSIESCVANVNKRNKIFGSRNA